MTVKIITDTLSDITADMAAELGVTVVPLYVRFGEEIYRDRVDITTEEFYRRLVSESTLPSTTQPTPNDFTEVYKAAARETDEILVVTVSSKLSGTYQSATQAAKEMEGGKTRIVVIDSLMVAMPQGLVVVKASEAVKAGAGLDDVTALVNRNLQNVHLFAYFDTLKYLAKGGRIGKAQGMLGSMLSVKPILTMKEGEMAPLTRMRSKAAGMDYLYNSITAMSEITGMAVEHTTNLEDAEALVERLSAVYPKEKIYRSTISPVVGTYAGPGALAVTVLTGE
jgi:DegV family protein with EDD domain